MTIRDLLVHIDQTQAAQQRLEAGLKLAERFGSHLTALYLAAEPFMRSASGYHLPADGCVNICAIRKPRPSRCSRRLFTYACAR